jgi:hypothetical protein
MKFLHEKEPPNIPKDSAKEESTTKDYLLS